MNKDEHDHKHCLELFEKLSEYLDNELDEVTCKELPRLNHREQRGWWHSNSKSETSPKKKMWDVRYAM